MGHASEALIHVLQVWVSSYLLSNYAPKAFTLTVYLAYGVFTNEISMLHLECVFKFLCTMID